MDVSQNGNSQGLKDSLETKDKKTGGIIKNFSGLIMFAKNLSSFS